MAETRRKSPEEFHHMEIHPASTKDSAGGVMTHTTYSSHAPGQGGGPAVIQQVEVRHHPTRAHLDAHLDEHEHAMFGEDADRAIADGELRRPGHNEKAAGERD